MPSVFSGTKPDQHRVGSLADSDSVPGSEGTTRLLLELRDSWLKAWLGSDEWRKSQEPKEHVKSSLNIMEPIKKPNEVCNTSLLDPFGVLLLFVGLRRCIGYIFHFSGRLWSYLAIMPGTCCVLIMVVGSGQRLLDSAWKFPSSILDTLKVLVPFC